MQRLLSFLITYLIPTSRVVCFLITLDTMGTTALTAPNRFQCSGTMSPNASAIRVSNIVLTSGCRANAVHVRRIRTTSSSARRRMMSSTHRFGCKLEIMTLCRTQFLLHCIRRQLHKLSVFTCIHDAMQRIVRHFWEGDKQRLHDCVIVDGFVASNGTASRQPMRHICVIGIHSIASCRQHLAQCSSVTLHCTRTSMKKRGVKLVRCIFTGCASPCPQKRVVCDAHWCDCCADTSADDGRYVTVWERIHFVGTKHISSAEMKRLKNTWVDKSVIKSLCPAKNKMARCQARVQGRKVSQHCDSIFPSGLFGNDDMEQHICSSCRALNRCVAHRMNERNVLVQCWNVHDMENPQRKALRLCSDDQCNVRVKCLRHIHGCKGGGYNDDVTRRDLTPRQLCKDCVGMYCLCMECGRMAPFEKSILFSKYVYKNAAVDASARNRCIYCIRYNGAHAAALLQWWVLRPTVDKWISGIHAHGILSAEQAAFVMLNWNDCTPPQRALYLHKKRGKSNVRYVMKNFGGSESTTELFYRTSKLPTDVFLIVLRMVLK